MDLDELRAFLAVVEEGSLLGAADRLKLSRATVRRRLDELELRTGTTLLLRSRHGAVPTEAGRILAKRGQTIMLEVDALTASVREVGSIPSGELRMALPVGLPLHLAPPLIALMRAKYPQLVMRVFFSDEPVANLLRGVDVALCMSVEPPEGPWLIKQVAPSIRERLLASRDYLERWGVPTSIAELKQHTLLSWEAPYEDPTLWPTLTGSSFSVSPAFIATNIHLLRQCVGAGLGIALLPDPPLPPDLNLPSGALCSVLDGAVGRERALYGVVPRALVDIPRVEAFLTEMEAFMGKFHADGE
ncbi:MAG: LysR family transcriptional regulator [Myxococcota bacterium]